MRKIISVFIIIIFTSFIVMPTVQAVNNIVLNQTNNVNENNTTNNTVLNNTIQNEIKQNTINSNTLNSNEENNIKENNITNTVKNNNTITNNTTTTTNNLISNNTTTNTSNIETNTNNVKNNNNFTNSKQNEIITNNDENNETEQLMLMNATKNTVLPSSTNTLDVKYSSHVQNIGWQSWQMDGNISGTTNCALRLEGIKIELEGNTKGNITYQAHVQNVGWQNWVDSGKLAGTENKALRLEAIKIKLNNLPEYSIAYRVHIQNIGWQEWKTDGEMAGTTNKALRIEAIQIKLISKKPQVTYKSHVQNIGWQSNVTEGNVSGTTNKALRLEALKINLTGATSNASIIYQSHVQNVGWQNWTTNKDIIGTTDKALRLEAIRIKLNNLPDYSIYYRVHVQNIGWQEWKKDGEMAGTTNKALRVEAIEIKLVYKSNSKTVSSKGIDVSYHNGTVDWNKVKNSGIQFAMIRLGYGSDEIAQDDRMFERNVSECIRLGIPYGVYLYSYATNILQAQSEAKHALRLLQGKMPRLGVWIDMEDADGYKDKYNVSNSTCVQICDTFCSIIQQNGYSTGVYASYYWFSNKLNDSRLDKYDKWVAQWGSKCTYNGRYTLWQYTNSGKISGINGNVDMDMWYQY